MTFIMETATVAAIITAASSMFATIVTTIINNRRLKEIEKEVCHNLKFKIEFCYTYPSLLLKPFVPYDTLRL